MAAGRCEVLVAFLHRGEAAGYYLQVCEYQMESVRGDSGGPILEGSEAASAETSDLLFPGVMVRHDDSHRLVYLKHRV